VVPFLNAYGCDYSILLYASSACAVSAAIFSGLLAITRPQEDWIRYRHTSSTLEGLRARFQFRTHPFDGADAGRKFVDQVEQEIAAESDAWRERFDEV
jgi:hypothetical protein